MNCGQFHMCDKNEADEKYISIFRGDDTDFTGGTGLAFSFESPLLSLDGYKIEFELLTIKKTVTQFEQDPSGKWFFILQFSHADTVNFPLCFQYATMTLIDPNNKRKTISNDILIHVTDEVDEVYGNETKPYSVNVRPGSILGAFKGLTFDLGDTIENRMAQIAQIFLAGSGTVIQE